MTNDARTKKVLDATGIAVGRLATEAARILQGKHKATYEPHIDHGDFVEIQNVDKIKVTGNKLEGKLYYRHTGYPGGLKKTQMKDVIGKKGMEEVIRMAVKNMLPNNRLRKERMKRLTIN